MRAFAAEREELQRFTIGMDTYVDTVWRQCQVYFVYSSLSFTFLPYLTYCIILFFAAQPIHYPEGCAGAGASMPNAALTATRAATSTTKLAATSSPAAAMTAHPYAASLAPISSPSSST